MQEGGSMTHPLSQSRPGLVQSAPSRSRQILIVDDNASIRNGLCEVFNREPDFEVCGEAENGREAIRKAQALHPDLIILDFAMPVMNGLDAARALRKVMPHVPLLMYSAFGDKYGEQQAGFIGITALISKSEHASCLVDKARSLLRDKMAKHLPAEFEKDS
jgi:DNA-binding NarL/FixJ family response regulator